jgi:hypothetical protein
MSTALPGEHLCFKHQGNHSHYAEENCTICTLQKRLRLANRALADVSYLIAAIDHPKARIARIGIIDTLQATDIVNPNL